MLSFHNDPAVKAKYQARLREHRKAEQLVQGQGFDSDTFKGCAVGCTLNAYEHKLYPAELGLPVWLAHLEDHIFEGLPARAAEQFAEDFLAAIPVGADLSEVRGKLAILRHRRDLERLESNTQPYASEIRAAIRAVIDWISAGEQESASARSAASWAAARSASRSSWSWSAWSAASAESADSAADSASWAAAASAWSADSASWAAAASAESSAAADYAAEAATATESVWATGSRSAHYEWEAKQLLALLAAARTQEGA